MKKLIVAAAALIATSAVAAYKDGSYVGEGKGKSSVIKVQVVVAGGRIAEVKVLEQKETPMKIKAAQAGVIPAIVKANGTGGVKAVSGASFSSRGIIAAVDQALAKAK